MPPAILSLDARREMHKAVREIGRDNVSAARRFPDAIATMARHIGEFPNIGVERPLLAPPPYRFGAVRGFPYLVVYDPTKDPPLILRILHGAQDLQSVLKDLPRRRI